jgi:8-oxo-dGTP pyrophosphatase MutT (NUDIX family)
MISFDAGTHRFHLRAAAIIRRDDRVLLHRLERDDFWSLPGGRVEPGETGAEAVVREMREELGLDASAGELALVVENFFSYAGAEHHEVGLYFDVAIPAQALCGDGAHSGREGDTTLIFTWFRLGELAGLDLRPAFLKAHLARGGRAFRHVVNRDATPLRTAAPPGTPRSSGS